ncbi:hypothetical protein JTE90_021922 [Oedothorax gibbosus]|uniref:Uncharacterized protein n=1 Tax=Oedothorax gibbosus TaxID=931172 RepID=A0AAV6VVY1_9ARAC|nr:hypothetical protein JTE90_021922 [Oedothorax gibbosus]
MQKLLLHSKHSKLQIIPYDLSCSCPNLHSRLNLAFHGPIQISDDSLRIDYSDGAGCLNGREGFWWHNIVGGPMSFKHWGRSPEAFVQNCELTVKI